MGTQQAVAADAGGSAGGCRDGRRARPRVVAAVTHRSGRGPRRGGVSASWEEPVRGQRRSTTRRGPRRDAVHDATRPLSVKVRGRRRCLASSRFASENDRGGAVVGLAASHFASESERGRAERVRSSRRSPCRTCGPARRGRPCPA
ncbi:hypothetical protein E4A49_11480 [Micrococcus lylae]|uniref:Uncharacterized protein n=1 Tax=Micrococcus lylae TaxID=1273 RepID=A0ABY2K0T4_9MICC|nr:hypothetical protein E4A49_11480 [Micrococcus lylae]